MGLFLPAKGFNKWRKLDGYVSTYYFIQMDFNTYFCQASECSSKVFSLCPEGASSLIHGMNRKNRVRL